MATILDAAEVTPEERAAIADEPRCGVWVQSVPNTSHCAGDGRALDQAQTDVLIVNELHRCPEAYADQSALVAAVGWPQKTMFSIGGFEKLAYSQRGGIHSDPLVRLLAFRAWGDRDRAWRKRDTVKAVLADIGMNESIVERARKVYGFDGFMPDERGADLVYVAHLGNRQATARRTAASHRAALRRASHAEARDTEARQALIDWYLDVFDELDAKLEAGGEPLPSGPLTFDITAPA